MPKCVLQRRWLLYSRAWECRTVTGRSNFSGGLLDPSSGLDPLRMSTRKQGHGMSDPRMVGELYGGTRMRDLDVNSSDF